MRILAYDTSTRFLTCAVLEDEMVLAKVHREIGIGHAAILLPCIAQMLAEAGLELGDLDAIAVGIGPGSFTGLRVGVSTAKGLCLAAGIDVVSVPTLDVIAYNYRHTEECVAPILDARKKKIYSTFYKTEKGNIEKVSEYLLMNIDDLIGLIKSPTIFLGDAVPVYGEYMKKKSSLVKIIDHADWYPRGEAVARLGMQKFKSGIRENIDTLVPMYLHPKECNVRGYKY